MTTVVVPEEQEPTAETTAEAAVTTTGARRVRRTRRRKPLRRFLVVTHRWLSLVLGLLLLVMTTSGALLLYRPELAHVLNHAAYSPSGGPARVGYGDALATVAKAHPGFKPTGVIAESGVLKVHNDGYETFWTVDPTTGRILGRIDKTPTWIGWVDNLHECLLSCEGEPGYIGVLAKDVPKTGWLGFDGAKVSYGSLVLGVVGLLLLYLSLSGLWLWFPRPSRWRQAMSIRWRRGRFARDTDLHKVLGMLVLPGLLVWAVTGAGFELKPVESAWYAVVPGSKLPERPDPTSVKSKASDIGPDRAVAAAERAFPRDRVVSVDLPATGDATATYTVWLSAGFDPYGRTEYPGDRGVAVDRHTGKVTVTYGDPRESTAQSIWDSWSYPVHSGYIVNGWWRLPWLVLGLSPLALAVTGLSTWLLRRRTRRERARARAAAA